MGIKEKVATGTGIALASVGLTTCNFGAVDPAPAPLDCKAVGGGQDITATGVLQGDVLTATLTRTGPPANFTAATVTDVRDATLIDAGIASNLGNGGSSILVRLRLPPLDNGDGGAPDAGTPALIAGSFTLMATLQDGFGNVTCNVTRTFHFTVAGDTIQVAERSAMPLGARHATSIALLTQDARELVLQARTRFRGARKAEWSASGGSISTTTGDLVRWSLPEEPGLYQLELVMRYGEDGEDGMAIDTMTFEVS